MSQLSIKDLNKSSTILIALLNEINRIPIDLTKKNKSFQQFLHQVLSTMEQATTNNNTEQLRKIVILIYKVMFIQTHRTLWITYWKSGIGQLLSPSDQQSIYPIHFHIWPKELKITLQNSMKLNKSNEDEICTNFVQNYLHELNHQLQQYENDLTKRKRDSVGYTLDAELMIKTYIERNLSDLRMEIDHQIELVYYDYHIQALKLVYEQHHPTKYQVGFNY